MYAYAFLVISETTGSISKIILPMETYTNSECHYGT